MNRIAVPVCLGLAFMVGCGAQPEPETSARTVSCDGEGVRPVLDCASDLGLKERVADANVRLSTIGLGLGGSYEERAVGQVTDATYLLALKLGSLCREYNACVIPRAEYTRQAEDIRSRLSRHLDYVTSLDANDAREANSLYENAVPDLAGRRIRLEYRVEASAAGTRQAGGHADGGVLHSGDLVQLKVRLSATSHLYVLLLSSQGSASTLFPQPEIGVRNPIPAGDWLAIPDQGAFRLDSVPGLETLYLIASESPLKDIELRLSQLAAGQPAVSQGLLAGLGDVVCGDGRGQVRGLEFVKSSVQCAGSTTRGIALDPQARIGNGAFVARPTDPVVVVQHRIEHRQ